MMDICGVQCTCIYNELNMLNFFWLFEVNIERFQLNIGLVAPKVDWVFHWTFSNSISHINERNSEIRWVMHQSRQSISK